MKLLLTCEHGGNQVPRAYAHCFAGARQQLDSHEGRDIGALGVYDAMRPEADAGFSATTSRLLIELNRSLHHPKLFSPRTRSLPLGERERIIRQWYLPFRTKVHQRIQQWHAQGHAVCHISVHSFTPVLHGEVRTTDIGLLYDPQRLQEKTFASEWRRLLHASDSTLTIHMNRPYRGTADGHTTALRNEFPEGYIGLELEVVNARIRTARAQKAMGDLLRGTLVEAVRNL